MCDEEMVNGVHAGALKGLIVLIVLACMAVAAGAGQFPDAAPGTIMRLTDDLNGRNC
ncbi:hypothetical protein [Methanogenium sp. MK-MG]|uniref:hypothetical protein n=1 Tax=Methanogenium sp. MK-MG TaxID=2599926 RepID=UPI0013EDF0D1|nr:hypothetical protein [Methanogenium sp. MK-MG]KAF1074374.1 hypothetical protein MKMG_01962 [Methanogenium sp. MK-MG]